MPPLISPTAEEIDQLLAQKCISTIYPWCTNDPAIIEAFYKYVCGEVARVTDTSSRIEWNHYGCGYASFIDAWFYKPSAEFAPATLYESGHAFVGVAALLSRLSPYFILMEGEKHWDSDGGSSYMPARDFINTFTRPATTQLAANIRTQLERQGMQELQADVLSRPLPLGTKVPTILTDAPYTVFDGVFYWED